MKKDKILIIGALGQIGTDLTIALRNIYGESNVLASDLVEPRSINYDPGYYEHLNVMDKERLEEIIRQHDITQIYLLAAILSAKGEANPHFAWRLNMESLSIILDAAISFKLDKVFWPSSIAIFGPNTPRKNTPQHTITDPTTAYGISKLAGERWCEYYHYKYGLDVRSIRYPGLISYKTAPGGGTTDYAVEIYHDALDKSAYTCFLKSDAYLPMMYMPDAIRCTIELMDAPADRLRIWSSYNVSGMSFCPEDVAKSICNLIHDFEISYAPDYRQEIADGWPGSIDDTVAREDWNWKPEYDLDRMTEDMLFNLKKMKVIREI